MQPPGRLSALRQFFWAAVIVAGILAGCALALMLRNTELVNPDIQQRKWIERKQQNR